MIAENKIKDKTLAALLALSQSTYDFHSCGSRFFGDAKPDSDFDFFHEESDEVKTFLLNEGFQDETDHDYRDVNSVDILSKGLVTVITVRSVEARLRAQEHIISQSLKRQKGDFSWWDDLYMIVAPNLFEGEKAKP